MRKERWGSGRGWVAGGALGVLATAVAFMSCGLARRAPVSIAPPPSVEAPAPSNPPAPAPPLPVAVPVTGRCPLGEAGADGVTPLERTLRDALASARFDKVSDLQHVSGTDSPAGAHPARIAHAPSVDVAVIAFPEGCPPVFANAMSSREIRGVHVNRLDPQTLALKGVRLRRWDQARWDAADPAAPFTDDDDVLPPEPGATVDFTVPYPASVFKLLVAVKILALVDRGALTIGDRVALGRRTRTIREWMTDMILVSDDDSTRALVKKLHDAGEEAGTNALFAGLGLSSLQIHDTSPETGRNWQPGRIHMSAWDTARLLWLIDPDAPAPTWKTPSGAPVDAGFLRPESRRLLVELLGEQAFHDALSTNGLCGVPHTRKGIPALMPERWIDREGRPVVAIGRGVTDRLAEADGGAAAEVLGDDVRKCNARAEVTFAHKTGLTENFGSDAGIVRGIPGKARRHYIISFFSNLGYRYTDENKASVADPCHDLGICYTQRIAALGATIDAALRTALEPEAPRRAPPDRGLAKR